MVFNTTFNNISGNCRKTSDKVTDKNYDIMLYGVHPTRVAFELTMH